MHEGHRSRMRERFLQNGPEGFADHELLELFLYYSIPRADTNPVAHRLYEHFGSFRGILEAEPDELLSLEGIGPSSAMLLKLLPEMLRRYAKESLAPVKQYDTLSKIGMFFFPYFLGLDHERLYAMFLNNRMGLIDCVLISQGTVNTSEVSVRRVAEIAIQRRAASVVLAHNHPNGLAIPSSADVEVTDYVNRTCSDLGINLLEHLIIADNRFWPIMKQHCGMFRCSPLSGKVESRFFEKFYDVDETQFTYPPLFPEEAEDNDGHKDEEQKGTDR